MNSLHRKDDRRFVPHAGQPILTAGPEPTQADATLDLRRYPGMPHTVNQDELDATRALLQRIGKAE